jgi:hypothetical protein
MCTVSYFRNGEQIIVTSNRDEHKDRPMALAPIQEILENLTLFYPKDPKGNGTWFCVKSDGSVLVLMNGAEKKHIQESYYRKSRGLILLELSKKEKFLNAWLEIDLENIEPFTLIAVFNDSLWQLRWNGLDKNSLELDALKPHIWSSSTLYEEEANQRRKSWFVDFLDGKKGEVEPQDLWKFHTETKKEDSENGLLISRESGMLTKNITQCVIGEKDILIRHFDVITDEMSQRSEMRS